GGACPLGGAKATDYTDSVDYPTLAPCTWASATSGMMSTPWGMLPIFGIAYGERPARPCWPLSWLSTAMRARISVRQLAAPEATLPAGVARSGSGWYRWWDQHAPATVRRRSLPL